MQEVTGGRIPEVPLFSTIYKTQAANTGNEAFTDQQVANTYIDTRVKTKRRCKQSGQKK